MKKIKCKKNSYSVIIGFFIIFGVISLLGIPYWSKYQGWQDADPFYGLILILVGVAIHIFIQKFCEDIKVLKCKKCGEVFWENEAKEGRCPVCNSEDIVDIKDYYKKF